MVVPGHPEAVKERFVEVSGAVAVGISNPGQLRALHDEKAGLTFGHEAQWLVQAVCKAFPSLSPWIVDEDFAAMETHGELAAGGGIDPTNLGVDPCGNGDFLNGKGVGPGVGQGRACDEDEGEEGPHGASGE